MGMTLVKFLHSGDPDVIQTEQADSQVSDIEGASLVSAIRIHAIAC